jgi:ABC-type transport system involved in multi-copper enzyme maturation permease subunit
VKFIAFLRDSYKEAVSGWILQILLILAFIFIALVASTSFNRASLQDDLKEKIEPLSSLGFFMPDSGSPTFSVENYRMTNDAKEPWLGDYEFDVLIKCASAKELEKARSTIMLPTSRRRLENLLNDPKAIGYLNNIVVAEGKVEALAGGKDEDAPLTPQMKAGAPPPAPEADPTKLRALRFRVTTQGTKIENRLAWPHTASLFFGAIEVPFVMSLREWVYNMQTTLFNDVGAWIFVLMGVIVTAGFIPTIMRKGAVDLLISKPVSRGQLLVYKYLGGLTFVFILLAATGLGMWLVVGLRYDFWSLNFLAMIPILTFYFAVLYSISTLMAVLTRSAIVAILVTVLAWGIFTLVGWGNRVYHEGQENVRKVQVELEKVGANSKGTDGEPAPGEMIVNKVKPSTVTTIAYYAHYFTPHTYDLDKRAARIVARGILTDLELKKRNFDQDPKESWGQIFGAASVFIAVMLGLSYWRFATRDG